VSNYREIRADFDRSSIVVYQAFNDAIADAALKAQRFVAPFSVTRMTWIKPSYLWLMERSGWGTKSNQERILAIRISRQGWDWALHNAVLTTFDASVHPSLDGWRTDFESAVVHVQWDPERSIQGKKLDFRSIQIGLSRSVIAEYVSSWISEIKDLAPLTAKLRQLRKAGKYQEAKRLLPSERIYETDKIAAKRLGIGV
jgi:Domain of unknown function (DUF4291)